MVSPSNNPSNELYNLRWNSYFSNLVSVFTDHQSHEALVDVTIGCEGQLVKAHRLVLSACSSYFQEIFQKNKEPNLVLLLKDVKFEHLLMVVQFMYKGEVKVADAEMQQLLHLGKMLQIKGLCSVELQNEPRHRTNSDNTAKDSNNTAKDTDSTPEKCTNKSTSVDNTPESEKNENEKSHDCEKVGVRKRKLSSPAPVDYKIRLKMTSSEPKENKKLPPPAPLDLKKKSVSVIVSPNPVDDKNAKDVSHIPRPPNAFMIFANQWRKKLAVEYPHESNKEISVRLGNMWKSLSQETKDAFYEDAKKADEEHKVKYPGYYYSPKEARHRKMVQNVSKTSNKTDSNKGDSSDVTEVEFIEIKCEDNRGDGYGHSLNSINN